MEWKSYQWNDTENSYQRKSQPACHLGHSSSSLTIWHLDTGYMWGGLHLHCFWKVEGELEWGPSLSRHRCIEGKCLTQRGSQAKPRSGREDLPTPGLHPGPGWWSFPSPRGWQQTWVSTGPEMVGPAQTWSHMGKQIFYTRDQALFLPRKCHCDFNWVLRAKMSERGKIWIKMVRI